MNSKLMASVSAKNSAGEVGDMDAAAQFIEHMGLTAEEDGLPRIAGRMWGFFVVHGGPCSFAEVADKLAVSRGSISTNARILRDRGIIERVSMPGDRQDYYRLTDKPFDRMMLIYMERMRRTQAEARALKAAVSKSQLAQHARLDDMISFYDRAARAFDAIIERPQSGSQVQP